MRSMFSLIARRYDDSQPVEVTFAEEKIVAITPVSRAGDFPWIAPGLIDLQVNGAGGIDFNSAHLTVADVQQVCKRMLGWGVTGLLATCTTDSQERLRQSLQTIAAAVQQEGFARESILGIHLEGPAISPDDGPRGAHPKEHVRPPNWQEFTELQAAAGGLIRLVTLSPEYEAAPAFIQQAVASGVRIAIGHTRATSEQIQAAVEAGATLSTHLGNGAHPLLKRHPNYIWDQLAEDRLWASLIVDGHHLPPAVVKTMVRAKGVERILLVGDQTGLAGLPPGRYDTPLGAVEMLDGGKLVVAGQREILAGATAPLPVNIALLQRFAGVDLRTAVDCASRQPAQFLGCNDRGRLQVGSRGDAVIFRPVCVAEEASLGWIIEEVVQGGKRVELTT